MTLSVLISGTGLFFTALALHVLVWNLFRIKKEILWLAVVFYAAPITLLVVAWNAELIEATVAVADGLLYMALASVYVQTYPALREDIPSIRILVLINRNSGSMTRDELIQHLSADGLFTTKILDLENDALIRARGNRLHLTAIGRGLANIFYYYRKFLGRYSATG